MNKEILHENVYYYEDGVQEFEQLMKTIDELDQLSAIKDKPLWGDWTSSNDKTFIYGQTQAFDLNQINQMEEPFKSKTEYIYNTIMKSMHDVCKDYADAIGDTDEPRLFPVFNIKKYNTGSAMGSHYDQLDGDKTLRYSLVIYLNDDCEGGEISFKLADYSAINEKPSVDPDYDVALKNGGVDFGVKPKAGSIIIFPSSAPYFHTAHIVKSGIKYMIPGHWIHNAMELHHSSQNSMLQA